MNEQELKSIISVYQQKTNDLMAQNVVLEAKLSNSNQLIEALTNKINELNEKLSSSKKITKSSKNEDVDFA
jgi:CII-binding regulator of phage lambda lysogenization HflD